VAQLEEDYLRDLHLHLEELENRDIIELLFEDGYGD
jgi:hypothetical protein